MDVCVQGREEVAAGGGGIGVRRKHAVAQGNTTVKLQAILGNLIFYTAFDSFYSELTSGYPEELGRGYIFVL